MKQYLLALGYYDKKITKISNNHYGPDTKKAVGKYQSSNKDIYNRPLAVDYKIGKLTWDAITRDYESLQNKGDTSTADTRILHYKDYPNISKSRLDAIEKEVQKVSTTRQKIVKESLRYAYDRMTETNKLIALYIYGANLYESNLSLHIATAAYIDKRAKARPGYFDGGRAEWMKQQVKKNPNLPCSDCSGLEIGYMRKFGIIKSTTDTTANSLCSSGYSSGISKKELKPGDWVGKSGHIATYVGANLAVEFVGGAYGCQLTDIDDRIVYNYMENKLQKMSSWTKYRRPKAY